MVDMDKKREAVVSGYGMMRGRYSSRYPAAHLHLDPGPEEPH